MFRFSFICITLCVFGYLNGTVSRPLPNSAYEKYPYSTVGVVQTSDGWLGSGSAVGPRTVLTAAHVFYDSDFSRWAQQPYTWSWKRNPRNANTPGNVARSFVFFEDYTSFVDDQLTGRSSIEAFNRDVYILQFSADITTTSPALLGVNQASGDAFKMIVGYPAGYYDFFEFGRDRLHATGRGEATSVEFNIYPTSIIDNPPVRLYRSSGIKTTSGNSGGPMFAYLNGQWQQVGILVGGNRLFGESIIIEIDDIVKNMIDSAADPNASEIPLNTEFNVIQDDLNYLASDAETIGLDQYIQGSIFPAGDMDLYVIDFSQSSELSVNILNLSDIAIKVEILDDQLVSVEEVTVNPGTAQQYSTRQSGIFYARVSANGNLAASTYSIGIVNNSRDQSQDIDFNQTDFSPMGLGLNESITAKLGANQFVDYYEINILEKGTLMIRSHDGPDLVGLLFTMLPNANFPVSNDEIELIYDFDNDSFRNLDFQIEVDLEPGTYYLQVSGSRPTSLGTYNLTTLFRSDILGTPNGDTDINDRFKLANSTRIGNVYDETLDKGGDFDTRRISLGTPGVLTIWSTGSTDTFAVLFNDKYNAIIGDQNSGEGENFRITQLLDRGTYYVRIQGANDELTGDYSVEASFERNPNF